MDHTHLPRDASSQQAMPMPIIFHTTPTSLFFASDPGKTYWLSCAITLLGAVLLQLLIAARPRVRLWLRGLSGKGPAKGRGQGRSAFVRVRSDEEDAMKRLEDGDHDDDDDTVPADGEESKALASGRDDDEDDPVAKSTGQRWRGQGVSLGRKLLLRAVRAGFEVVIVCVGYLLMLAVMTMNVGYFLSVLAGVFLGLMLFGSDHE